MVISSGDLSHDILSVLMKGFQATGQIILKLHFTKCYEININFGLPKQQLKITNKKLIAVL